MTILLATTSRHKQSEIQELLAGVPDLELQTLADYPATEAPEEDGASFAQNARIKAQFYAAHFGKIVLADDSGLATDALDGAPGIHSARWVEGSDADRVQALLEKLRDVPMENRGARYVCALCLASADSVIWEGDGVCEGEIVFSPRGENGFGYDPIFGITLATGADAQWVGKTMAEAPPAIKAQISHRARAASALAGYLKRAGT